MAKSCTDMADIYKSVEHCQGQVSMPGAIEKAYFIKKAKIAKWPKLPFAEATDIDKVAVYDGDFALAADAKFHRIDLMPNEMEPESEQVGAYGSYHFNNKATLPIPGTAEKATGTIAMMNNDDVIIVIFQRDGKARIIGDLGFHTNVKPAQKWGKSSNDANQTSIEASCESLVPLPFYPGKLVTDDGEISGATGQLISPAAAGVPGG